MALYYIEEVSLRKESPRRFVTGNRWGHYHWAQKDKAKKYTPGELLEVLVVLRGSPFVFQPIPVEVEYEPT